MLLHVIQGLARRKNCCAPEMIFVTVYCPLTTAGALETVVQPVGAKRFVVDCKVNPALLVGHAKIIEFGAAAPDPAGLNVTAIMGGGDTNAGENAASAVSSHILSEINCTNVGHRFPGRRRRDGRW